MPPCFAGVTVPTIPTKPPMNYAVTPLVLGPFPFNSLGGVVVLNRLVGGKRDRLRYNADIISVILYVNALLLVQLQGPKGPLDFLKLYPKRTVVTGGRRACFVPRPKWIEFEAFISSEECLHSGFLRVSNPRRPPRRIRRKRGRRSGRGHAHLPPAAVGELHGGGEALNEGERPH